jgi:hypothetical protein
MFCRNAAPLVWSLLFTVVMMPCAWAQQMEFSFPFTQYTVADGLAQMQVRSIYADREGLVWIGTQGGLSYFDGTTMHTIHNLGPLDQQYIVKVIRGSNKLFLSTHHEVYTYEGAQITKRVSAGQLPVNTYACFEDHLHHVWMLSSESEPHILTASYELHPLSDIYPELADIQIRFAWGNVDWDYCYLVDDRNRFYVFHPSMKTLRVDSTTLNPTDRLFAESNTTDQHESILIQRYSPQHIISTQTTDLFRVVDNQLQLVALRDKPGSSLRAVSPLAPLSYIERQENGNALYLLQDTSYVANTLPAFNYPRFKVEANRKIYIATDEGLIVVHGEGLQQAAFPACDYPWSVMPGAQDGFFLGCYKTGVYQFDADGYMQKHYALPAAAPVPKPGDQILSNYLVTPDALLWGSNGGFMTLRKNSKNLELVQCGYSVEAMAVDPSTQNIIAGGNQLIWLDPAMSERMDSLAIIDSMLDGRSVNDMVIAQQQLWVALPKGIMRVNLPDKVTQYYSHAHDQLPCAGAVTIEVDASGTIWIGGTCGLMKRTEDDDRFIAVLPEIIRDRVNQVSFLPGNRLACSANNNLYVIDISTKQPSLITIYNASNGLHLFEPSENGSSVIRNRYLWLPSVEGIQRLDLQKVMPGIFPAQVRVNKLNGKEIDLLSAGADTFFTTQVASLLDVSVIDHTPREWLIRFSLNHADYSPWQSARQLLVSGLLHGVNRVSVVATWNVADSTATIEDVIYLETTLPFLQRHTVQAWFAILVIAAVIITILAIVQIQVGRKHVSLLKADLYRNRLKTIQAYLNPHFLFNTLTSIQDRLLQQDIRTGNDIIIRLSRVFRKVLDTGRTEGGNIPMIRLSEEISLIEDMVWLNNQQHSVPIQFNLMVAEDARHRDPMIPPLLIQPFVENAFKHAFGSDVVEPQVHVSIGIQQELLTAVITDNGVGYDGTDSESTQGTMGTPLARERMDILNQLQVENKITFQKLVPHGTKVIIQISLTS